MPGFSGGSDATGYNLGMTNWVPGTQYGVTSTEFAIDVVVGCNLLREGLDLPEASLVAKFEITEPPVSPSLNEVSGRTNAATISPATWH